MPFDGPLTEEQRRFAEQNHALVYKFLHQHGLSVDEYYDIVVFGFLLAVQRYLTDASLAPYAFSTVAWSAMESALRNHRRTARRKQQSGQKHQAVFDVRIENNGSDSPVKNAA